MTSFDPAVKYVARTFEGPAGWRIERLSNGSVRIINLPTKAAVILSGEEWASAVAAVSQFGEDEESFRVAAYLHGVDGPGSVKDRKRLREQRWLDQANGVR